MLATAETQMVLQPVTPEQPDTMGGNRAATAVGEKTWPLPMFPRRVGVVTSPSGAAIRGLHRVRVGDTGRGAGSEQAIDHPGHTAKIRAAMIEIKLGDVGAGRNDEH